MHLRFRHVGDDLRLYLQMLMERQCYLHLDFLQYLDGKEIRVFRRRHNVDRQQLALHLDAVRHLAVQQSLDEQNLDGSLVGGHLAQDAHLDATDAALVDVVRVDEELERFLK